MATSTKYIIGALILLVSASIIYISLPQQVKMRVDTDKTTFYVYEGGYYKTSGRELNKLYDFPDLLSRDLSQTKVWEVHNDSEVNIYRQTVYLDGPVIIDNYRFIGNLTSKEQFPVLHEIRIFNASGLVYQYEVSSLIYSGSTMDINTTSMGFGRGMKIEWTSGFYWAKVYSTGSLKIRYHVTSDEMVLYNRMFDPTVLYLNGSSIDRDIEHGEVLGISATGTGQTCLYGDHPDMGTNFTCGSGSISFNWTARGGIRKFNDTATAKNYTFAGAGCSNNYLYQIRNNSEIIFANINLKGYSSSGNYPKDVKVDIGGDGVNDTVTSGLLQGNQTILTWFNDSSTTKTFSYNGSATKTAYVKIPKGLNVTGASLNLSPSVNDYVGWYYYYPRTVPTITLNPSIGRMRYAGYENYIYQFGGRAYWITGDPCNKTYYWTHLGNTIYESSYDVPFETGSNNLVEYAEKDGYGGFIVCGGYSQCSSTYQSDCRFRRVYPDNPTRWVDIADFPSVMAYTGWVMGGKVYEDGVSYGSNDTLYVMGGQNSTGVQGNCWKYNITADSWTTCASLPRVRAGMSCEWWNTTHIVCYSGYGSGGTESLGRYTETYDTVANSWQETDMGVGAPSYGWGQGGFRIGGKVYKVGGYWGGYYYDILQMNSARNAWIYMNEVPTWSTSTFLYGNCVEYNGRAECFSTSNGAGWQNFIFYVLPKEPFLQVGNYINNSWNKNTDLIAEENISNFVNAVNYFVNDCTANTDGYCLMPLYVYNGMTGNITIKNMTITTNIGNLNLNMTNVTCGSNYCNTTVKVCSDQQGIAEISKINITYYGTTPVNITACDTSDCDTQWATVYYSKYSKTLPYTWTDVIFFLPDTNSSKNVTAYFQTDTVPIVNITGQAQDKGFKVALKLNGSYSCLNLTFSNSSVKTNGFVVSNTTWNQTCNITTTTGSCGNWGWADLNNCDPNTTKILRPQLQWKSCCSTCMSCGW